MNSTDTPPRKQAVIKADNVHDLSFDAAALLARKFAVEPRCWDAAEAVRWARDFGAGLPGALTAHDSHYLDPSQAFALPMIAVPLCDGEFWQQQADTGIDWRRLIHAEERLTVYRPLPMAGQALLSQAVIDIRDRGAEKGASMLQKLSLTEPGGLPYADIEVTTVLRGNGGYGGLPPDTARPVPLPDRAPDAVLDIQTPAAEATRFCLSAELKVASGLALRPGQRMLRGVGCFGLAGRAALALACGNDAARLRQLSVRYGGPMLTDETMRFELWNLGADRAVFRMRALERDATVLSHGTVSWSL